MFSFSVLAATAESFAIANGDPWRLCDCFQHCPRQLRSSLSLASANLNGLAKAQPFLPLPARPM